jgi:hypothetical protein
LLQCLNGLLTLLQPSLQAVRLPAQHRHRMAFQPTIARRQQPPSPRNNRSGS